MQENINTTVYEIEVGADMEGTRIDLVLSSSLEELSRSHIQKLIDSKNVSLNGKSGVNKKEKVKSGDVVVIQMPEPEMLEVAAEDIPLNIVYEDDDLLVVNKPKGMVVHPGAGNFTGTLVNALMHHCRENLSSINGIIRPGIVHRIDKDTAGLLMIAKNDIAHNSLASQLAEHTITRVYNAIVYNGFKDDEGTIDAPIGRDPKNRLRQAVTQLNSRRAVTHYKVLERFTNNSYIEAHLETGRTHQIRVHMAYINHPLAGDLLYGPRKKFLGYEGQLLFAGRLGFVHPRTGEYMEFKAELPKEFEDVLNKLRNK